MHPSAIDTETIISHACSIDALNSFYNTNLLVNISTSPLERLTVFRKQFNDLSTQTKLGRASAIWKLQDIAYKLLAASKSYYGDPEKTGTDLL